MILREVNRVGEGQKNIPKLRFKGYEDAWEQRKLGSAINVRSGKDYKHLDEGEVPVYGTGGYMLSVSEALENTQDAIGIGRKGTIDKPFVLKAPFWTVDTLFYCIPKGNNSLVFLYPLFQSINWKLYDESTGVPSLSKTAIEGVTINLTSKDEQYSIGEYFESVDNLITLHQRKYDALKSMKKTLLSKMFPKNGEDVPEIRFKEFTYAWEQRKLGDVADKVTVKNSNLQYIETFTNSAEVGIISQRDYFDHDIANLSNLDGYYIVQKEDFVYNPRISTSAPVGPINRNKLGRIGVMSPLYTVFRTHNVDTTYLEYFFKSQYWHSFMIFHGDSGARADRFSIKDAIFFEMPIPLPDIDEQQKIGDYLNSVDYLITLHQRKLEELKNMKKTLLQQMFV